MVSKEVISGLVITFMIVPVSVYILYQYGVIHDLLSVIDQIVAGALATITVTGIAFIIHGLLKKKADKIKIEPLGFYSPIHTLIVRVNNQVPRYKALYPQNKVGYRLDSSSIDVSKISATISQNMGGDGFTDKDLEMWIEIEEEIKRDNHFYLGNDRQKWFDELEAKFVKREPR